MKTEQHFFFAPFHLDLQNERLSRGSQIISLRPKTLTVLRYLLEHAGRLVTKEELLSAVWPGIRVSETLPKDYVQELRKVLEDKPKTPQFIETVHGRGYRFIAPLTTAPPVSSSKLQVASLELAPSLQHLTPTLVGRETELAQLQQGLEKALRGERQVIFITGEPGIGKTTVVEAFLQQVVTAGNLWIARGQCLEQYGIGEAYMPMLEALGHLCRASGGERLLERLSRHAPTWLVQMPWLVSAADLEMLQKHTQGATRERMLREIGEAVEALTAEQVLILVLEDLHWSDYSTLDLISVLAQRRQPAKLLLIGTYRPVEAHVRNHPLRMVKQELQMHRHCEEIALGFLSEAAVSEYLQARFPGSRFPAALARLIHRRTEGNPLFMVNMVDYLVGQAAIAEVEGHWQVSMGLKEVEGGVPESLRRMIEKQIEELAPQDRRLLEVASVAGVECSAAAVAAGLEEDTEKVEERCEELVRKGQFLRARESKDWPDGTVAGRYGFIHALYQEVLYDRVTRGRRIKLHRKIGERQEAGYGERRGEIAGELAIHFERGRDYRRAVQYLQQAAENALRRCAYQETISNLTKALELLKTVPDTPERAQQELTLHMTLGTALVMTKGYAAPEVGTVYSRARELCRQVGETPQLFPVLWGLWVHYFVRGDFRTVRDLSEQLLRLARNAQDPALLLEAQVALGLTSVCLGEVAPALTYLEQGIALYDPQQHRAHAFVYGQDPGMVCLSWAAWALWLLGYPDQALKRTHEALALAQELAYPFSSAYALGLAAVLHQLRREGQQAQERAEEIISLATEQGFALWLAAGNVFRGWALADQGQEAAGMAQLSQGLAAWQATGAGIFQSYGLALLTEACGKGSRTDEGLAALNGALTIVENSGERWWEAELQRLKGQLTLQSKASQKQVQGESKTSRRQGQGKARARPGQGQDKSEDANTQHPTPSTPAEAEAEACFVKAIEIARRQGAKLLELRATVSLARLWQQQGKQHAARNTLSEIYGWFTEGFDTRDLQEARTLLAALT